MALTFNAICGLLQDVENASKNRPRQLSEEEQEHIRQVIVDWFRDQRDALGNPATDGGAVLSILFPHRRRDRVYGFQAYSLARKLSRLLAFNRGQRALFESWETGTHGDLGVYTERAMKPWDGTFSRKQGITIERINRILVQLAAKQRFSDEKIKRQRDPWWQTDAELKDIFVRLESWEAKWLVRLLLRDYCTIELNEKFVMRCYHFLLPDLLAFQNDFEAAFDALKGELSGYPAVPQAHEEPSMRIEAVKRLKPKVGVKIGRPPFYKAWSIQTCLYLVGNSAWAAEVKYDGEFCEIHVELENGNSNIRIFSKNGKDATANREPLRNTICTALHIGQPDTLVRKNCIVLGEMLVYSDEDKKIMPFWKIRNHVTRSGHLKGTIRDFPPHKWEHLMIVFFDVLLLDDEPILRHSLQDRRRILRKLIHVIPGRSMRSEWTLLDIKTGSGLIDLKEILARAIALCQGLVLKPLHAPYLSLPDHDQPGFFIKVKKDYLGDMGGERDLGDFAVIGARFDAQLAAKTNLKPLHWTHFYLGCCTNRDAALRTGVKPRFTLVATLSLDESIKAIPKCDARYLNIQGYVRQVALHQDGSSVGFDVVNLRDYDRRMSVAFKNPLIVEILGGGFEKPANATFEMLRHPRIQKIHLHRTWEDAVTMQELERMAEEKFAVPDADELDGHAKDVALLAKKYIGESQVTAVSGDTTRQTTQSTSPPSSPGTMHRPSVKNICHVISSSIGDKEMSQEDTQVDLYSSQGSDDESIHSKVVPESHASRSPPSKPLSKTLIAPISQAPTSTAPETVSATLPRPSTPTIFSKETKRSRILEPISPPQIKRRKTRDPLQSSDGNRQLRYSNYRSQKNSVGIDTKVSL